MALVTTTQGLTSELARAISPRCITVALALPVGAQLGASSLSSITAVAVVLTGAGRCSAVPESVWA